MIETLKAFCEAFLGLGCLGGLMFLDTYMRQNPKDWIMWALIALTTLIAIASAVDTYLGTLQ